MNILITGATGFIGRQLVSVLITKHRLTLIQNYTKIETLGYGDAVSVIDAVDINMNIAEPIAADVLIHLAATRPISKSDDNEALYFDDQIFISNLLPFVQRCGVRQIINISSKSVYGLGNAIPFLENDNPLPHTFYGQSKLQTELKITKFATNHGISYLHLRLGQVIGLDDSHPSAFNQFVKLAQDGLPITLWGEGAGRRSYIYVKDVALLISLLIGYSESRIFNVAWPKSFSFQELAESLKVVFSNTIIEKNRNLAEDECNEWMDTSQITTQLKWMPAFPTLGEAFKDMFIDQPNRIKT